ncbi:FYN-binding protein 1 [Scleropages formosus]|uniref:FYN-binding protein 1 n=1 Tax=Scleropages formosus TaxID=113540 RepID=UPI00087808EF|nr:FYN-binding protein 1-like [Scleropages formosus]
MSYPSGGTDSALIVSSIKDKKANLESCLEGGFQNTQEKTKPVSKTKSLEPRAGPMLPKLLLQKPSLNAIVLPKSPLAASKPLLFAGKSKSERDAADNHPSTLKLTPGSKMKTLAAVTKAQMQEAGAQNTFKLDRKDTDSESSRNSKQTTAVPLVSGLPNPPFTKKPSLIAQMTSLSEKALEPDVQGPVDDPSPPPKKLLPAIYALGKPPPKPNRPPRVQLEKFTKVKGSESDDPQLKWTGRVPPNLPSSLPKMPPLPSLTPGFPSQAPAMRSNPEEECSYDDVGVVELPPYPPSAGCPRTEHENGDTDEVYEDIETIRPPPLFDEAESNELYDNVDTPDFPPPLPIISPQLRKSKGKQEERDPKRQKKLEKEEKDFRKKFKFEGMIQVLYQVSVIPVLTCKKWGNKDLPLQPGETIDVIVKPVDDKLIGRNQEGKFGYISTSNIVPMNNEIYDDVTEGCIYDND